VGCGVVAAVVGEGAPPHVLAGMLCPRCSPQVSHSNASAGLTSSGGRTGGTLGPFQPGG
jgi:hypothetical protein